MSKFPRKTKHLQLGKLSLSYISFAIWWNLIVAQSPSNWVFSCTTDSLSSSPVNYLWPRDSGVWAFNGNGVFEINGQGAKPRLFNRLQMNSPDKDVNGDVYYYRGNKIYRISENKLFDGEAAEDSFTLSSIYMKCSFKPGIKPVLDISCLAVEPFGDEIWIGTDRLGVFSISKPSKISNHIWDPVVSQLCSGNNERDTSIKMIGNTVQTILCDSKGFIWIGFENGLMYGKNNDWSKELSGHNIKIIEESVNEKGVWVVGSRNNPYVNLIKNFQWAGKGYEGISSQPIAFWAVGASDFIRDIHFDNTNDLWVAGNALYRGKNYGGIENIKSLVDTFMYSFAQAFSMSEGFLSKEPRCITHDGKGIIWIGTGRHGVFYVKKTPGLLCSNYSVVRCHDDSNGKFSLKAVEGKPPYHLFWESRHHGSGDQKEFTLKQFENLKADTFRFYLIDAIKDTGEYIVHLDNPSSISASLIQEKVPSYSDTRDGVVVLKRLRGGRVLRDELQLHKGYRIKINDEREFAKNIPHFGLGKFSISVYDTMGCSITLRDSFVKPQQYFRNIGDTLITNMIQFKKGIHELRPTDTIILNEVVVLLQSNPTYKIQINGHALCSMEENCEPISKRRASVVAEYLATKGIKPSRIRHEGFGQRHLRYEMEDQRNRRVEFILKKG